MKITSLLKQERLLTKEIYRNDVYISKYSSNLSKKRIGYLSTKGYSMKKRLKSIQLEIETFINELKAKKNKLSSYILTLSNHQQIGILKNEVNQMRDDINFLESRNKQ